MELSVSELIDELCIVNIKIFFALNTVEAGGGSEEVAKAAIKAQQLNKRRSDLKNAIEKSLGHQPGSIKIYG